MPGVEGDGQSDAGKRGLVVAGSETERLWSSRNFDRGDTKKAQWDPQTSLQRSVGAVQIEPVTPAGSSVGKKRGRIWIRHVEQPCSVVTLHRQETPEVQ